MSPLNKNTTPVLMVSYALVALCILFFSYGWIDHNLVLSLHPTVHVLQTLLERMTYDNRTFGGVIYLSIIAALTILYVVSVKKVDRMELTANSVRNLVILVAIIVGLSFPFTSYDLFNYILTAKVAYTYKENPYVIMPIEIPNEPGLRYTRAANKTALYGPTWILTSYVPHVLGGETIWGQILAFKLLSSVTYLAIAYLLFLISGSLLPVVWFALNPLVIMELVANGHNDGLMMMICLTSVAFVFSKQRFGRVMSWILFFLSTLVKGATLVLLPLMVWRQFPSMLDRLIPQMKKNHITTPQMYYFLSSMLLAAAFGIAGPLREELYPWYGMWCLTFGALLIDKKYRWYQWLLIAGSIGLELRPVAYMMMGYYEGPGPLIRLIVTFIPVIIYGIVFFSVRLKRKSI
jgi:hypothetical protein